MSWVNLFHAFVASSEMPRNGFSVITTNPVYKEFGGSVIEISSDAHTLHIELGGDYAGKYEVTVRIDCHNRVTATIIIKKIDGGMVFPLTSQDECFDKRVEISGLREFDGIEEVRCIFEWINRVFRSVVSTD